MESFSVLQLAERAFKTVAEIMSDVAFEKRNLALCIPAASLLSFSQELASLTVDHKTAIEEDGTIYKVLRLVEKIISASLHAQISLDLTIASYILTQQLYLQPPGHVPASAETDFPTLWKLAEARHALGDGDGDTTSTRETAHPVLSALRMSCQKQIEQLVFDNTNFKNLLDLIQKCSKIKPYESPDFAETTAAIDEPPDHQQQVRALYDVLSSHVVCHCTGQDVSEQHWAKLRLTPTPKLDSKGLVQFEMLFSATPNPSQTGIYWQDVQMLVSRISKVVRILDSKQNLDPAKETVIDDSDDSEKVEKGQFCTHISSRCGSSLRFRIALGQFRILNESEEIEQTINSTDGVTLESVLNNFRMPHGMRPVLAYVLAKSVWQYYNSKWMNTVWTKNKIFFMETGDDENSSYFCKPYIATEFGESDRDDSESFKFTGVMHRFPRVLALGIMLLEIGTGQSGQEEPHECNARTVNEQWRKAKQLLENAEFEADCDYPTYKLAVAKCLDPKLFKNAPFTPAKPKEYLRERQSILYREVIHPLRGLVKGAGWSSEFDKLERMPLAPKKISRVVPTKLASTQFDDSRPTDSVHSLDSGSLGSMDNTWLRKIDELNKIIKKKKKVLGTSLKIAILDTGCDEKAPSLRLPGRKKIKLWKDFAGTSLILTDDHGHGTHLATLILQIAPYAELCVARVAKRSERLQDAAENIVKAIDTAVFEWDVDFVSMSFGFPNHVHCIEEAIARATHHKKAVTFFAAANNDGFNSREMFPANLGGPVLSIRGTNMHGGFEQKFNPPKSSPGPVFGTLGKDVYSDWAGQENPHLMSGSSVATAIAVGIAAILIEYATRSGEFDPTELQLMRTRRGVLELFSEIGIPEHDRDEHYYVAPFDLFNWSEKDRLARIRTAISRHPENW